MKKKLRLWFLRFCGILWALVETFGAWAVTALVVMCMCFGLSCLCSSFPLRSTGDIVFATSAFMSFLVFVYVIIKNMHWAKRIAEESEDEIDTKALLLGFSVLITIVLCVIAVVVYHLYCAII